MSDAPADTTTPEGESAPLGATDRELLDVLGRYGPPAYVRRARGVELALELLLAKGRKQREEWLLMVRINLARLHALAGDWSALTPWLDEAQRQGLQALYATLAPTLRAPLERTTSARGLRRALRELIVSLERFNKRWLAWVAGLDLGAVNEARAGYNRFYLVEKEAALRNPTLARRGYQPLGPLTVEEVLGHLPVLFVPKTGV
jgi:hypothetical protein